MTAPTPRSPDRILMTVDAVGGVWTYAMELARSLLAYGVKIDLALMGPPPSSSQRAEAAGLPDVTVHEGAFPLEWMDDPWAGVERAGEWLLALAEATRPDLVHLNGYVHATLPWGSPVLVAAHSCVCSWWWAVKGEAAPARYDEYRRRVRAGLAAADLVVAPTAAMLADLHRHHDVDTRGRVIHNARDPEDFSEAAALVAKAPEILAAGRAWDAAKNLVALDAAASRVRWPVHLAGDCRHPDGGSAHFTHLRCLGTLDAGAMRARFTGSAIYALPARYEPFGLSALEAGLCGCALVLGDIPSLREVWGDAAVFVSPDDGLALAAALNVLIENDARRADLARRARARALEYTPARMADGYLSAYRLCLETPPLEAAA